MQPMTFLRTGLALAALATATTAQSQTQGRTGWVSQTDLFVAHIGDADLDDGGDVSSTRYALRFSGIYLFDNGDIAGVSVSGGYQDYEFGSGATRLWDDINAYSISAPVRFSFGETGRAVIVPSARWAYEDGASKSDGFTYGVFAGVSWQVTDTLRIGPAFGVYSEIEGDGVDAFPALLIDWEIADRWLLSTGSGLAATQGPGVRLSYAHTDTVEFSLAARYESAEFRLDNSGLAPGGVGKDETFPVVLAVDWTPHPAFAASVFAGATFGGEMEVEDSAGNRVSKQDYDTAPIVGFAVRVRF